MGIEAAAQYYRSRKAPLGSVNPSKLPFGIGAKKPGPVDAEKKLPSTPVGSAASDIIPDAAPAPKPMSLMESQKYNRVGMEDVLKSKEQQNFERFAMPDAMESLGGGVWDNSFQRQRHMRSRHSKIALELKRDSVKKAVSAQEGRDAQVRARSFLNLDVAGASNLGVPKMARKRGTLGGY